MRGNPSDSIFVLLQRATVSITGQVLWLAGNKNKLYFLFLFVSAKLEFVIT